MDILFIILQLGFLAFLIWLIFFFEKRKVIWKVLLLLGGLYISFVAYVIYLIAIKPPFDEREFNQRVWFAEKITRFTMADDISESNLLIGKDSVEVVKLIGYPTTRYLNNWTYDTGDTPVGLGFGFYYLHVKFQDGKVADCKTSVYVD